MTTLFIVWVGSVLLFLLLNVAAFVRLSFRKVSPLQTPSDVRELIDHEIRGLISRFRRLLRVLRPYARKAGTMIRNGGEYAHNRFVGKLFGHIETERGRTVSFFLKHIAEYQEITRREAGNRVGY